MPDTVTFTRDWFLALSSLRTHAARWTVLDAVCRYAFDGSEPSPETFDTDDEKRVFMSIKKQLNERKRRLRYYTNSKAQASKCTSKLDGGVFELEMEEASNLDVQFRRSKASNLDGDRAEKNPFNIKDNQEYNLKDITIDNAKEEREKINGKENEERKPAARPLFKVPTFDEVKEYVRVKGYSVDPEEFYSFYESQGWHVGKNKMRNWHMALSYWQSRMKNKNKRPVRDYTGI